MRESSLFQAMPMQCFSFYSFTQSFFYSSIHWKTFTEHWMHWCCLPRTVQEIPRDVCPRGSQSSGRTWSQAQSWDNGHYLWCVHPSKLCQTLYIFSICKVCVFGLCMCDYYMWIIPQHGAICNSDGGTGSLVRGKESNPARSICSSTWFGASLPITAHRKALIKDLQVPKKFPSDTSFCGGTMC